MDSTHNDLGPFADGIMLWSRMISTAPDPRGKVWLNCLAEGAAFVAKGAPLGLIAAELIERAERHKLVEELGGAAAVESIVAEGLAAREVPEPDWEPEQQAPEPKETKPALLVPLCSAFPIDEKDIPLRDWVIPGLLLRRNLSVLVAPPSSGKSLLTLQLAIAIALGIPWGGWFPRQAEKVLVINSEDDHDEMRRRLFAAAKDMEVDQAALVDRVLLAQTPEDIVVAKIDHRNKSVIRTPVLDRLVATIDKVGVGVIIADPFAETFEGDENSNSEVKWGGLIWREVARKTRTALWLVHHSKKYSNGMAGDQDASRGGGALIGTARIVSTLFTMGEDEAKLMDVPVDDRGMYVRFDDAKANHNAKGVVKWFKKKTIVLDNGNERFGGDEVGVLTPWKPPGLMDSVHMGDITMVLDKINRGMTDDDGHPTGQLYGPESRSGDRWAGRVIVDMLAASEDKAKGMVKAWIESGVLVVEEYDDPVQRKKRKGVQVDNGKRPDRGID